MKHATLSVNATLACLLILMGTGLTEAAGVSPTNRPGGYDDSGVQLNSTRRYLEEQRIRQRIEEGKRVQKVETPTEKTEEQTNAVRFTLNDIQTSIPSGVFTPEEVDAIRKPYIGQEVTVQDLYKIVAEFNKQYVEKGYLTCKAFLAPQRIENGEVVINLIEGVTDKVSVEGNKHTRSSYIRNRMHFLTEEIKNTNELNQDLLRFNATNDMQLRIALRPGETPGTTDYVLTAIEPQNMVTGLFMDNAGSKTSGEYRAGLYWMDRSLTGNRDNLFLSMHRSEGTKAFSASYMTPVNRSGTKVGLGYSTNSVHITDGALEPLNVTGHSYAYNVFMTTPMETTEKVKSQWGLEVGRQHSVTEFANGAAHWVDDTMKTAQVFADLINYGNSSVFYQKHAYRFGDYEDINHDTRHYGKYIFNTLYQKHYAHGQSIMAKLDGQLSQTNYLPSSEMYYIGGLYSVRGYKESVLGGDSGFNWNLEYSVPLNSKKHIEGYLFTDGGSVYGDSAFDDHTLVSAGVGLRANLGKKMTANLACGIPFIKTLNGTDQNSARVHFSLNGQF